MTSFKGIHNEGEIIPGRMAHFEFNQVRTLLGKSLKFIQNAKDIAEAKMSY